MENTATLTEKEKALLGSFQTQFQQVRMALENQMNGALQAIVIAHDLPPVEGGYRLSDDGSQLLPAKMGPQKVE